MGLDSYLYRMPRYKGATVHDVHVIEEYLNWQREKAEGSKYFNCNTLKEWCGVDEQDYFGITVCFEEVSDDEDEEDS